MPSELLANAPAAAAVIVTVGLFLRHMSSERDKDRALQSEEREKDRTLYENHLSKSITVLEELAHIVKDMRDDIRFGGR